MKTLSILFLIFFSGHVIAQNNNKPYIYNSTLSIGEINFVEYPDVKVFFHEHDQLVDTSKNHKGNCMTKFIFQQFGVIANRIITLRFDKPVISCELKCPNGASQVTTTANKGKTEYKFVIDHIKADAFSFIIYSDEKIYTKIDEVSKYITRK